MLILNHFLCQGQPDSIFIQTDSLPNIPESTIQPIGPDTLEKKPKKFLSDVVIYPSRDSTVMDVQNKVVKMYGDAQVNYEDIELKAEYIEFSFDQLNVKAYGLPDTTEQIIGKPKFKQGSEAFTADTIKYNFKSKKGLISKVRTNDGESYVHTNVSKKLTNNHIHNYKGKFTTCDAENPHFHFAFNKMVVVPNKKIVTGPIIMKLGNVPTPLALPFGYFPNTEKRQAGILIPDFGESPNLGFYLLNGGWYQPLGSNWDTQMTGDIYSRGSWGLRNNTRYRKRYKYNGSFSFTFNSRLTGDKNIPETNPGKSNAFNVVWSHSQDSKARPGTRFSASVNVGTSNTYTNNLNTSQAQYLTNTFNSNISYSKNWDGRPYNLSINARHSQNTLSRSFSVTIPSLTFNVNRFFLPLHLLKDKNDTKTRWYEKFGMNYNLNFENRLNTTESEIRFDNFDNLRMSFVNGVRHQFSITNSIKIGYISFNPSMNFTERWHFQKIQKIRPVGQRPLDDVIVSGFEATRDYSFNASFTTKMYGMFNFNGNTVQAVRHTFTPSLGFSYTPEFDYNELAQAAGDPISYNPFETSAFRQNSIVESGNIGLNLVNNFEAKVKMRNDTIASFEKIKLIENITARTSYNLIADSLNLAPINLTARTRLFKKLNLNYRAVFDPYQVDGNGIKTDRFQWSGSGPIFRNVNTNFAIGGGFTSKNKSPVNTDNVSSEDLEEIEENKNLFTDFSIPWNININYTLNIAKDFATVDDELVVTDKRIQQGILFNGGFTVLEKWKIRFDSGYDFTQKEVTPTTLSLDWDLHCWAFGASFVPFGVRKSYFFTIGVKASILQDLKIQGRGDLSEGGFLF